MLYLYIKLSQFYLRHSFKESYCFAKKLPALTETKYAHQRGLLQIESGLSRDWVRINFYQRFFQNFGNRVTTCNVVSRKCFEKIHSLSMIKRIIMTHGQPLVPWAPVYKIFCYYFSKFFLRSLNTSPELSNEIIITKIFVEFHKKKIFVKNFRRKSKVKK